VKILPFTGVKAPERTNLAIVLLKYVAAFVPLVLIVARLEPWMEASVGNMATAASIIAATHFGMQAVHRRLLRDHLNVPDVDEDQQQVFQTLGLRY
jgi:negative regulator of sigma E activity